MSPLESYLFALFMDSVHTLFLQEFQYDAKREDNGKDMTCVVSTSEPAYEMSFSQKVNVESMYTFYWFALD